MQTVPDKSQRPQAGTGTCGKCGGTGRVNVVVKGESRDQPCIACRGTGQGGGRGYAVK